MQDWIDAAKFVGGFVIQTSAAVVAIAGCPASSGATCLIATALANAEGACLDGCDSAELAVNVVAIGIAFKAGYAIRSAGLRQAEEAASRLVTDAQRRTCDLPRLTVGRPQLEAKYKHAPDFGVHAARGAAGFDAFGEAIESFLNDIATVRLVGTYRGRSAILSFNPESRLVVVQAPDGAFVSGWRMSEAQFENVITRGSLGGG